MKKQKRTHLHAAICFMLITVMTVMVWAEPVQAAKIIPQVHTMDLYSSLAESMPIRSYGKITANAGPVNPNWKSFPEGATVYVADSRNTCEGLYIYRVYYEGQAYTLDSKYVTDLKDTTWKSSWINNYKNPDKVKVQKYAVAGDVLDPNHYYYIYSKPSAKPENCIGAISAGGTVEIVKENYNSKWAKVMCAVENTTAYGYIQRAYLNTADSYLAGVERKYQKSIKLAKKAKIAYSGILKNYWNDLTKKEFCRLAVNWYQATGHTLPKQSTKSPFTDTKDKHVIMAHQLGIVKSNSSKKFNPNKVISANEYNTMLKRLVKAAGESEKAFEVGAVLSTVSRREALYFFCRAYQAT